MTSPTPAGWYPDPTGRHHTRYWDGTTWTNHVASAGQQALDTTSVVAASASSASVPATPAGWYPDPHGQSFHRYWDGAQWTEHVSDGSRAEREVHSSTSVDQPVRTNAKIQRQARKVVSQSTQAGGGTLFTEPVLVVNQRVKMVGGVLGYAIFNQSGRQLGMVEEVRRGFKAKASDSFNGRTDDTREYRFRVVDMDRRVLLTMTRPPKWFSGKSKMVVEDPTGATIGRITQETYGLAGGMATVAHAALANVSMLAGMGVGHVAGSAATDAATSAAGKAAGWVAGQTAGWASGIATAAAIEYSGAPNAIRSATAGFDKMGHVRFGLEADGERLGSIHAETIDEWDFRIQDPTRTEIARITKTWSGWAKERFTKADNYVLEIKEPLTGPLLSLVIAAALALDIALKQGNPRRDPDGRHRPR